MPVRSPFLLGAVFTANVIVFSQVISPQPPFLRYVITDLGKPDGTYSNAYAINNKGDVVGEDNGHASLWQSGKMRDLGVLDGFAGSRATAINEIGQVVGTAYAGRQRQAGWKASAFLWQNGTTSNLGSLGGNESQAYAINNKGQIVGKSYDPKSGFHAFIWRNGTMTQLSVGSGSEAKGINDAGLAVGEEAYLRAEDGSVGYAVFLGANPTRAFAAFNPIRAIGKAINAEGQVAGDAAFPGKKGWHAFLYRNEKVTDLGTLDGNESRASAINNKSQVVGWSYFRSKEAVNSLGRHAFLWTAGKMLDLNDSLPAGSGWVIAEANGINDRGQIVGQGSIRGQTHAFLLTPVAP